MPPVHPRVCGEPRSGRRAAASRPGPSPRVRGTRHGGARGRVHLGSIPACAGNPGCRRRCAPPAAVHPRVCGEPLPPPLTSTFMGSIPACAGNPALLCLTPTRSGVHPRVCGEPTSPAGAQGSRRGPSPRVRGTLAGQHRPEHRGGSIPACAGNPSARGRPTRDIGVHPRVCGEPGTGRGRAWSIGGPSPRVRGTLLGLPADATPEGSIPACAGNPLHRVCLSHLDEVHPRVCGEPRPTH